MQQTASQSQDTGGQQFAPDSTGEPQGQFVADTSGGEQQPKGDARYIDRETFDQAISGLTQEFARRFEQLQQYMVAPRQQEPQQPQNQEPEFPDYVDFEQRYLQDPANFYKLNQQMWNELKQTKQQLAQRLEQLQNEIKTREYAERVYNYLNNQTEAVAKQYPVFQNKQAKELLKSQVAMRLQLSNGDLRQLDVPKIAKELNDAIIQLQVAAGAPGGQQAAGGQQAQAQQMPPAGAPAKPGAKSIGPEQLESLDDLDAMIDAVAEQAMSGGE